MADTYEDEIELDLADLDMEVEPEEQVEIEEETDEHYQNLCGYFDDEQLGKIGTIVVERYNSDNDSRSVWITNAVKGLKILGLNLDNSADEVFAGSCTATHPLILETAVKFQQKISLELFPANGPAKAKVLGVKTEEKIAQANRVQQFLNYLLTEEMTEFENYSDKCSLYAAIFGSGYKKSYWDSNENRPVSEFVRADLFVVNQNAPNIDLTERMTQVCPISIRTMENRMFDGFYRPIDINDPDDTAISLDDEPKAEGSASGALVPSQLDLGEFAEAFNEILGVSEGTTDNGFAVLEYHGYWNFKNTGLADPIGRKRPYVISVDRESGLVLSIRRDWSQGDIKFKRNTTFTAYDFIPSLGFYAFGLIHILGNFNIVLTAIMRSLTDAGQLYNLQGGYKVKAARIADNSNAFAMGEWKDVEGISGNDLGNSFLPHQFKEPSQILFALLQYFAQTGQEFADATDALTNDGAAQYGAVGTTMSLLEAAGKMYNGIYKRFHRALTRELRIISRLEYEFRGDDPYPFSLPTGEEGSIIGKDFDPKSIKVTPTSDPNVSSQAHRVAIENAKMDALIKVKGVAPETPINFEDTTRQFLMNLDPQMDLDKTFTPQDEAKPNDPMTDIAECVQGKPIKPFPGQNHQAHVLLKSAWLEDPNQGASKLMQQFVPIIQSNIREHQIMQFQEQIGAMTTGAATDPKTLEMVQAQAAQELARMSKLTATAGTPEETVANAVKLEAEAKAKKVDLDVKNSVLDQIIRLAEIAIASQREETRAAEADAKLNTDEMKVIADNLTDVTIAEIKAREARNKAPKD